MADTAAETTETAAAETPAATTVAEETTDAAHTPTDQPGTSDAPDAPSETPAGSDGGGTADAPAAAGLADALGAGDAETVTEPTAPAAEPAAAPEPEPTAQAEAPTPEPAPAPLARDIVDITPLADLGITDTTSLPDALQALATAVTTATENRTIDTLADAHGIPHAAARDSISLRDAIHTGDQAAIQAAIQGISQRVIGTRGASTIETALAGAAPAATTGPVSTLSALESALSGQAH